jgi:hypothetical protein
VQIDKLITTEELIYAVENYATESNFKSVAKILLEAISDWPTEINEPNELISELKKQINERLTFDNIELFLKTLSVEKDTWKMESLYSILKIFNFERSVNIDRELELEAILEKITKHYRE